MTRVTLEGPGRTMISAAKTTMAVTSGLVMPLNTSGGVGVVKIIQVFDYLGFVDIYRPSNLDAVL